MVEGRWLVDSSQLINEAQKQTIKHHLDNRITSNGYLLVKSQIERSQLGNKEQVIKKMNELVNKALRPKKPRIAVKVPKAIIERRLENKKQKSVIKGDRRKLKPGDY
jgi:ribosome-associated protein